VTKGNTFVVDIGNSHTVIGIYRGQKIVDYRRLTTRQQTTSDEVLNRVSGLFNFSGVAPESIRRVGLSTVVPSLERPWVKALKTLFNKPIQVVSAKNSIDLPIAYTNPMTAGADRLSNIIALRDRGIENAIVVDMGTATTFDVMKDGGFAGGLIIPGINAGLYALTEKAARLLPVSIEWPDRLIADNTDDAVRAGLLYGFLAELETLIVRLKKELGKTDVPVYATGGWGKMIAKKTSFIDVYDPYLTLDGIRLVAEHGNGVSESSEEEDEDGDDL
jgi:type III pantothenate kinase